MRTDDEIVARIKGLENADFFGFIRSDLAEYLPADRLQDAGLKLNDGAAWDPRPRDAVSIIAQITEYLAFAWDKANNCRGISAARSLNHMQAWLWMLDEDAVAEALGDYELYGKPHLREISERYHFPWRDHDDDAWRNSEGDEGTSADSVPRVILLWASEL